jgi:sugar lactone lactonase YvrE
MLRGSSLLLAALFVAATATAAGPFDRGTILAIDNTAVAAQQVLRVVSGDHYRSQDVLSGVALTLAWEFYPGQCAGGAVAAGLDGAILVTDRVREGIARLDLDTGGWQMVSDAFIGSGSEDLFGGDHTEPFPLSIAVEADGSILVAKNEDGRGIVLRVDPATGDRVVLAESAPAPIPNAFPEFRADAIAVAPSGEILVYGYATYVENAVEHAEGKLVAIDPVTGAHTPRAQDPTPQRALGLAVDAQGNALLADPTVVVRVDAVGQVEIASGSGVGAGPRWTDGGPLVVLPNGGWALLDLHAETATLFRIDPANGNRSVLSGDGVGGGPALGRMWGLAGASDGALVTLDCSQHLSDTDPWGLKPWRAVLVRVDPVSGDRETVFDPLVGGLTGWPLAIDRQQRFVGAMTAALIRTDPQSGEQTVFSSWYVTQTVGAGPSLASGVESLVLAPNGDVLLSGWCRTDLLRVDAASGDRSVVSGIVGAGTFWKCPVYLAMGADSYLYVADLDLDVVFRVDPANGNRLIMSGSGIGTGEIWSQLGNITWVDGFLYALDYGQSRVIRIDPSTGNRTLVSDGLAGSGPRFLYPNSIRDSLDGGLFVSDPVARKLFRVDLRTGDRSLVTSEPVSDFVVVQTSLPEPEAAVASLVALVALALRAAAGRRSSRS